MQPNMWNPYSRQPQMQGGPVRVPGPTIVDYTTSAQPVQVQEVVLPTRRTDVIEPVNFKAMHFRVFGVILSILAATTLALGIADVVLTYYNYRCGSSSSACSQSWFTWTWVSSGIWASLPIFLTGLIAMCVSGNPGKWVRVFALFCFISTVLFAPALVVLSSLEVSMGVTNFYTSNLATVGTVTATYATAFTVKAGIPIAIAVIGCVMFLMTAAMTIALCCCVHRLGIYAPSDNSLTYASPVMKPMAYQDFSTPAIQPPNDFYYPPRPQIRIPYTPAPSPVYQPTLPYMPTRYNNIQNPYGSGVLYGNFPARPSAAQPSNAFINDFFKPNNAYSWN